MQNCHAIFKANTALNCHLRFGSCMKSVLGSHFVQLLIRPFPLIGLYHTSTSMHLHSVMALIIIICTNMSSKLEVQSCFHTSACPTSVHKALPCSIICTTHYCAFQNSPAHNGHTVSMLLYLAPELGYS